MIKKLFIFAFAGVSLFAGAFDGTYSSRRADIKITESQGVVQFVLLGAGTGSMSSACDLSGNAMVLSKNTAGFQTRSDTGGCSVVFDFSQAGGLNVKSKGCQMFCTDRSSFDGDYKKTK